MGIQRTIPHLDRLATFKAAARELVSFALPKAQVIAAKRAMHNGGCPKPATLEELNLWAKDNPFDVAIEVLHLLITQPENVVGAVPEDFVNG